jgi:hypothetical protein
MKPFETRTEAVPIYPTPKFLEVGEPLKIGEMVLSKSHLAQLSVLLGRNIATAEELVAAAKNVTTLSVDGTDITLDSYLLNRLKSRCPSNVDFGGFLRDRVKELLASYAGC